MLIQLRRYKPEDAHTVVKLFYDSVHSVAQRDYTQAQLDAWAPQNIKVEPWCAPLQESETVVAEIDNQIVGFGNLQKNYFDRLFVHKDFQSMGIASLITAQIEKTAVQAGEKEIIVEASRTAKPFFEKQGYQIIKSQIVKRQGVELENFLMKKF